ncbi:MAG: glycosyltransferase family 2 protein [Phycisphaerae bacterium]|nr:glycosyltransferase family 2 protein [Phycisphaerae bacterium]
MAEPNEPIQISVVTPMHNEELCAHEFVRRVDMVLDVLGRTAEIIVVSDGSTDRTEEILVALSSDYPRLRCVFLSRNAGQCNAMYAGIQHALGDYVIVMDADLQNVPEEIPLLIHEMDKGFALVSGSRLERSESLLLRRLPSRVANWLLRRVTGSPIRDMGGFKCLRGDIARSLRLRAGQHRLLPALVHMRGGRTSEVLVSCPPRFAGKSHYGISRSFDVFFDVIMLWFQSSFKSRPLYLFGRIGVLLLAFDCIVMPWLLYEKFWLGIDLGTRPPFLIAIMFFLSALFVFSTGFILELLSDAVNTIGGIRPYVIRATVESGVVERAGVAAAEPPRGVEREDRAAKYTRQP